MKDIKVFLKKKKIKVEKNLKKDKKVLLKKKKKKGVNNVKRRCLTIEEIII